MGLLGWVRAGLSREVSADDARLAPGGKKVCSMATTEDVSVPSVSLSGRTMSQRFQIQIEIPQGRLAR